MGTWGPKADWSGWAPDPAAVEDSTENARLDDQNRGLYSMIHAFIADAHSRDLSLNDLAQFIGLLEKWKAFFATFDDRAQSLRGAGFPRLGERLAVVQSELAQKTSIFVLMYEVLKRAGKGERMEDKAVAEIFREMAESSAAHAKIRDEMKQKAERDVAEVHKQAAEVTKQRHKEMSDRWWTGFRSR